MSALPSDESAALDGILQRHRHDPTRLLQILIDAQDIAGWLPAPVLTRIAAGLDIPRARVEGVAGFYSFLYTRPVGRYRVLFSDNITDRMLGNAELLDALCRKLWIEPGHLSEDGLVIIVATVDSKTGKVLAGPDLVSRGFVYVRENESLMDGAQSIVENALERCVDEHVRDWNSVKTRVREALSSYIYRRTKRSPMILPILMEV